MGLSGVLQERLPLGCFMCQLFGELCFVAVVFYPFPLLFMNYCSSYDPALGCVCHGIIYLFVCLFACLASPLHLIQPSGISSGCDDNHSVQRT